jgi:hypothetical protein
VIALAATRDVLAQRPSTAEGPWSGQAQCVVVAKWADYLDEQTHTWRLTGEAPTSAPRGSAQVFFSWPATWIVQGSGRKTWPSRDPGGREQSERWAIANEMKMSLRITEVGNGRLRIGAEGQRGAPLGSLRVTEVSGRTRDASVQPWTFPTIEDEAGKTTISGTSTRTYPEGFGVGWGQPPKAVTTATCTWSFTRGGGVEQSSANTPTGGRGVRERTPIAGAVFATPSQQTPEPTPHPITTTPGRGSGAASSNPPALASGSARTSEDSSKVPVGTVPATVLTGMLKPCATIAAPQYSATPGEVTLMLNGPAGTGHLISRQDLGQLTPTPVTASSYTHAAPLDYKTTYQYVITGIQSNDDCTTASVSVTPPRPLTPQITATVTPGERTGRVTLSWNGQADRPTSYLVMGAGIPVAAEVPATPGPRYSFDIDNLQAGTHTWEVLPLWKTPTGNMSDVGGRVTATVTRTTGTYLVTVTGIICGEPTVDTTVSGIISVGHRDGPGDEIRAAAYLRRFDRTTQQLMEYGSRGTRPYGDVTGGTGRLQGGTMSSTGGIQAGDVLPSSFSVARVSAAQETAFPWKVWEGRLTDGVDALLVSPSLWEWDDYSTEPNDTWVQNQRIMDQTILAHSSVQARISTQVLGPVEAGPVVYRDIGADGPIGWRSGSNGRFLPNVTIVLTREIIEKALVLPWSFTLPVATGAMLSIPKPGIMVVTFTDPQSSALDFDPVPASYSMILQVERLPD